jgi:hypothetical protein
MTDDTFAIQMLDFAFSGKRTLPRREHRQLQTTIRQARAANKESPGKRRSRFWGYGPKWGRFA